MITCLLALSLLAQTEAEYKKAEEKLAKDPEDKAAHLTIGRWWLSRGDIEKSLPELAKGSDAVLRDLATHELEKKPSTALEMVDLGDAWTKALAKNLKDRQGILDRASFWYREAWPDLDEAAKAKLRDRLTRLYVPGPAAPARPGVAGFGPMGKSLTASVKPHSGANVLQFKLSKQPGLADMGGADPVELPKTAKEVEVTYWVLTDGTDRLGDKVAVGIYNRAGNLLIIKEPTFPKDTPVWTKYVHKVELPEGSSLLKISILIDSSKGAILFDDFSVKVDGKEVMYASFEK